MKIDNNTIIIIASTVSVVAMLIAVKFGGFPENITAILATGAVGLAMAIAGNLQRKPINMTESEPINDETEVLEKLE